MLSLAQSKAVDTAVLISGDADLAPGVIAAQALGLRVYLGILAPKSSTSLYLAAEADRKYYFPRDWVLGFAKPAASTTAVAAPAVASPGSTATVSQLPVTTITQSTNWIGTVAAGVLSSLQSSPQASLLVGVSKGKGPIPQPIDSQLLSAGKNQVGRALSED